MALSRLSTHHYTYADYLRWPDHRACELIDGIAYIREPPAPTISHQGIVSELNRQIGNALQGGPSCVYVAPVDVRLPGSAEENDQIDTVVQPDVLIVCDPQKIDDRGVRGAPDWIAEVLSPRTARHDEIIKLPVYERAGIREVWLIHPIDRTVRIYRLEAGAYGRATVLELEGKTQLTAVPSVTIDWEPVLARIL